MLTSSNLDELRRGRLIKDLPRTFRDVIIVARWFSIRYLWIDSLCILQDSQEDWQEESSAMGNVYANSSCNVAAAASTDPHGGLFRSRECGDIQPGLLELGCSDLSRKKYFIFDVEYWNRQVSDTVLHRRAWVFQERLLAPRILHFTEKQIFWECSVEKKCEAFPVGIPLRPYLSLKDFEPLFLAMAHKKAEEASVPLTALTIWNIFVKTYTICDLTRPTDKLIALSGVAHFFQEITGDEYIAGLWRSRLVESLDWCVYDPMAQLSSDYRAPPWSWACLDGQVIPNGVGSNDVHLISMIDAQLAPDAIHPIREIPRSFIVVKGLIVQAQYNVSRRFKNGTVSKIKIGASAIPASILEDSLPSRLEQRGQIHCIALNCYSGWRYRTEPDRQYTLHGLILEPISRSLDQYTRVGWFENLDEISIERFGIWII